MKLIDDRNKKIHNVYGDIMREYINNEEDIGRDPQECNNSILGNYAKQIKDIKSNASVAYPALYSEIGMIHEAGVSRTLPSLKWFLLFMAANPSEQVKISLRYSNEFP